MSVFLLCPALTSQRRARSRAFLREHSPGKGPPFRAKLIPGPQRGTRGWGRGDVIHARLSPPPAGLPSWRPHPRVISPPSFVHPSQLRRNTSKMEPQNAGSAELPPLPPSIAGGSLGPTSDSLADAAPAVGSALAPSSVAAPQAAATAHPPAGTVPGASSAVGPDQHVIHKALPDTPPVGAGNALAPEVVHPTSTFPVRDDIEPTTISTAGSTAATATTDALETIKEVTSQAVVTSAELVDAAEARLATTDPGALLDSATHAVEVAQHRIESAVATALAPDPNDVDPALAPFRKHDPQQLPPQPQATPHPSNARDTAHADKPAVAATETGALKATGGDAHILPVGQDVHPAEQAAAVDAAPAHLVNAQVKKLQGAERELKGEPEQGHLVPGMEDDKLFAMMRRFNQVSWPTATDQKLPSATSSC